jgi:hypothetical protein
MSSGPTAGRLIPTEELQAAVDTWNEERAIRRHGSQRRAAKRLGIPEPTFSRFLKHAAERGLIPRTPVMPGFVITKSSVTLDDSGDLFREHITQKPEPGGQFEMPAGHVIKGVSSLLDEDGNVKQQWIKTKEGELDPLKVAEWIKEAFDDYAPQAGLPKPVAFPATLNKDLLTVIPCGDWHLGMFAWEREVGSNWDIKIAEREIGNAMADVIARSPQSGTCVLLSGGDLFHTDDSSNRTEKSGNPLDVDGRYPKIAEVACKLMVRCVEDSLKRHGKVIVRILRGNHDPHSSMVVSFFLSAHFRLDPRVSVDLSPDLYWWYRFGKVLLGATHGHMAKPQAMPGIMAHRCAEDWGKTKFRYVHTFHLHHSAKYATEGMGVVSEIHQAPIPQDAWHHESGFLSGRSIQAITYHEDAGEVGRVRVALINPGKVK